MTLAEFVQKHRHEIEALVRQACPNVGPLDDDDLGDWVLNDEGLYRWAVSVGCDDL